MPIQSGKGKIYDMLCKNKDEGVSWFCVHCRISIPGTKKLLNRLTVLESTQREILKTIQHFENRYLNRENGTANRPPENDQIHQGDVILSDSDRESTDSESTVLGDFERSSSNESIMNYENSESDVWDSADNSTDSGEHLSDSEESEESSISNVFNVYYTNADGLMNKRDEMLTEIKNRGPKIIVITEMYPKNINSEKVRDVELKIDGCNVSRSLSNAKDRVIIIYIQETLSSEESSALNKHNFKESIWIILKLQDSDSLLLGAIYKCFNWFGK